MSATWKGHEFFGYWKSTHDPLFHEDLAGPVEGYIKPGLGYEEAAPGEGFVRIGVGLLEKPEEEAYQWNGTYRILDPGSWRIQQGSDWITFTHQLNTGMGVGYVYKKTIRLTEDGFEIAHVLVNTGTLPIETDQFNHNFFMIDGTESGPAFEVRFPFELHTESDLGGYYELDGKVLRFAKPMDDRGHFIDLEGYGKALGDHDITVENLESGAGVRYSVDKPLYDLAFWSIRTTLCPENSIWLSIRPGQQEEWTSRYTFFGPGL
jgi:hypothetical protein